MGQMRIYINGEPAGGGGLTVPENRPFVIRVEPEDPGQLVAISLAIGGVEQGEGAIPPRRPGGVEWRFTPSGAAGLLPLVVRGPGAVERLHIQVEPAKLTAQEYEFLLQDLRRVAYGIMYALYAPTHQGLQAHPPSSDPVQRLLERFTFLEQQEVVARVLHLIRLLPLQEVIVPRTDLVPRHRVRRVAAAGLYAVARHPERRSVPAIRREVSPDCYENRVVKLLLQSLRRLCRTLEREAAAYLALRSDGWTPSGPTLERLQQVQRASATWARQIDPALRQEPWPSVGRAVAADRPSTVFVMQPVYRELLQWYRRLQQTWEATLDSPTFTLPLRSVPELYEMWCFAKVVAALQQGLGQPGYDQGLIRSREGGFEFALERGGASRIAFRAGGGRRVSLYYNKLYRSFTELNYLPDISLEVEGPGGPEGLIVLDAKYRRAGEAEGRGFKQEDIDKMHTYRDAIRWAGARVASAFILYPGDQPASWGDGAIGAVPLRPAPEGTDEHLKQTLANCLGRFGIEWKGDGSDAHAAGASGAAAAAPAGGGRSADGG